MDFFGLLFIYRICLRATFLLIKVSWRLELFLRATTCQFKCVWFLEPDRAEKKLKAMLGASPVRSGGRGRTYKTA